jgi:hypothetical protein
MSEPPTPFFLVIADHNQEFFSVEGSMVDNGPWQDGARDARNSERNTSCDPAGQDRDAPATKYRRVHKLAGVPRGSILRAHQ